MSLIAHMRNTLTLPMFEERALCSYFIGKYGRKNSRNPVYRKLLSGFGKKMLISRFIEECILGFQERRKL